MRKALLLALLAACKQPPPSKAIPVPVPIPVPDAVPDASVEPPDAGLLDAGILLIADDGGIVEQEPNDKLETAQAVTLPASVKGLIWPQKDVDLYRFHVPADHGPISIQLSRVAGVDLMLRLSQVHGGALEVIGTSDRAKGEGEERLLSVPLKEGDYAVEVSSPRHRDASATAPYVLSIR